MFTQLNERIEQLAPWVNSRSLKIMFCACALAYALLPLIYVAIRNVRSDIPLESLDFELRYHETRCVRSGADPYDVWNGTVVSEKYRPFGAGSDVADNRKKVHSYAPWTYTYLFPLSFVPFPVARCLFLVLNVLAAGYIFGYFLKAGVKKTGHLLDAGVAATASFSQGIGWVWLLFVTLNFGLLLSAALLMMIHMLEREHHVKAGFLWALIMVKVQIGTLFIVPLLFAKRWKTVAVAVACCLCASLLPAWLVGKSPIEMILNIRNIGTSYVSFMTGGLFSFLVGSVPSGIILFGDFAVGLTGCVIASGWVSRQKDWLLRFLPAIVCCLLWTYSQIHDRLLLGLPMGWVMLQAMATTDTRHRLGYFVIFLLFTLSGVCGWVMTQFVCKWKDFNFAYAIVDALCLWILFAAMLVLTFKKREKTLGGLSQYTSNPKSL